MGSSQGQARFAFVGNGSFTNRGCEAIVRGTLEILAAAFPQGFEATSITLEPGDVVACLSSREPDPRLTHVSCHRSGVNWFLDAVIRKLSSNRVDRRFTNADPAFKSAICALQLGGDNYTLDYGIPYWFPRTDRYIQSKGTPVVLWGASVGPFTALPDYEKAMAAHLRTLAAITVRESRSRDYLAEIGVTENVYEVADPAFVMEPTEPEPGKLDIELSEAAIGLNFSPLAKCFKEDMTLEKWTRLCTDILLRVIARFENPVVLIPHVSTDYPLLSKIAADPQVSKTGRVKVVPDVLSAAETKWLISQCVAFAGARTHATIAAISTCVPTLSFAYSTKARGLNLDTFGHLDYCIEPDDLHPDKVVERLDDLICRADEVCEDLRAKMPGIRERAYRAGDVLRAIADGTATPKG